MENNTINVVTIIVLPTTT